MKCNYKVSFILVLYSLISCDVISQDMDSLKLSNQTEVYGSLLYETNDVGVFYEFERTGGIVVHSSGFGLNYRSGKHMTGFRKRIVEFELANIKHPKEYKTYNPNIDGSKGYVFGKLNALLVLRTSLGAQSVITSKTDMGGVELRYICMFGGSLGLLKPVYLDIREEILNTGLYEVVVERYNPKKHSTYNIIGKAPFLKGIDKLGLVPGGFAKLGLSAEYGKEPTKIKTLEVGMMVDLFHKVVPIMADINTVSDDSNPNKMLFFSFYLSVNYGKKW